MDKSDGLVVEEQEEGDIGSSEHVLDAYVTRDAVENFLFQNPNFFAENPHLLTAIAPPARWSGDAVVDMQRFIVQSLRGEIDGLRECASSVIETGRSNMAVQTGTHDAVLAVVSADTLDNLAAVIEHDFPAFLNLESAVLLVIGPSIEDKTGKLRGCPPHHADRWLGDREVTLIPLWKHEHELFGPASPDISSVALSRLRLGPVYPQGLLALGAAEENTFHPSQGTELLRFLSRIVERCLGRLLALAK